MTPTERARLQRLARREAPTRVSPSGIALFVAGIALTIGVLQLERTRVLCGALLMIDFLAIYLRGVRRSR
jgi:hypothetical protein